MSGETTGGASESDLVARVARGDAAAFRCLVEAHAHRLHGLAWRLLADTAEAEDVVQEAFARLWTGAATFRPGEAQPGAWLRRVARNLCLDRLRRRRFQGETEDVRERADDAPLAPDRLDAARAGAQVAAALAALPDRQRAALVLTYYEELPNAAAAEALDMQLKAFESLLFRARAAMRRRVEAVGLAVSDLPGEVA